MDVAVDAEGALDPRVQIELENLNNATDDINKLETELDEAHTAFRQLLSDTTRRLKEITEKLGTSCIEKARCYYEALEMARQAQVQCQQQAKLFQRASEIHVAAKETVALAEARFMSHQHEWNFDQAWQDMLNHATIKVMDAENKKAECGREHHRRALLFHDAEKKLVQLEEKHRRAIIKARPYFEVKAQCDQMLETQKGRVEYLQQTVKEAKRNYATSLRTLEEISNQIHQQRRDYDIVANGPREPGVGAELIGSDTCQKYENEFNSNDSCKISPIRYNEGGSNEKLRDIEKLCATKEIAEHLDKRSVDGSESKFTQWELELQASMEKLNRLSVEKSSYVKERGNAQSSSDLRDAVEVGTTNGTCYNLLPAEQSNAYSLYQLPRSTAKDLETFVGRPLKGTSTVALKSNISKSLNNSPVNRSTSSFQDKAIKKMGNADISKYVPNQISEFDIKSRKAQSSLNISNIDVDVTSKGQRGNDTLVSKNHVQLTNLPTTQANAEFLPAESGLSKGHRSAVRAHDVQPLAGSQSDITLSQARSSFNILQKSASRSANSSPRRLKNLLRSSARSRDSESTECLDERFNLKKLASKTTSIKELPLLSFFGSTSALIRDKSCSMIDLAGKQNLKTLLDNSHLGNIQAGMNYFHLERNYSDNDNRIQKRKELPTETTEDEAEDEEQEVNENQKEEEDAEIEKVNAKMEGEEDEENEDEQEDTQIGECAVCRTIINETNLGGSVGDYEQNSESYLLCLHCVQKFSIQSGAEHLQSRRSHASVSQDRGNDSADSVRLRRTYDSPMYYQSPSHPLELRRDQWACSRTTLSVEANNEAIDYESCGRQQHGYCSLARRNDVDRYASASEIKVKSSSLSTSTDCSRRPIRCPRLDCSVNVAFSALTHHFLFDHPEVPILSVDPGTKSTLIVSYGALSCNSSRCLALLLVSGKLSDSAARLFGGNQVNPKYRNRLPLPVLAARLHSNRNYVNSEEVHAGGEGLCEKDVIIAWVAGLDVGDTADRLRCSIQAVDNIENGGFRSLTYTGPVTSLRAAQCPRDVFLTGDCIVLHEGLISHITSGCTSLNVNVIVH